MTLSYWLEGTKKLWIKADIAATGTTTYIKVKKTSGYSPNPNNVFLFFDGFDDEELDTDKWTVEKGFQYSTASSLLNITNGSVKVTSNSTFTYNSPVVLEVKSSYTTLDTNGYTAGGFFTSSTDGFTMIKKSSNPSIVRDDNTNNNVNPGAMSADTFYKYKFQVRDATTTAFQLTDDDDVEVLAIATYTNDVLNEKIVLGNNVADTNLNETIDVDYQHVFVRKYASNTITINVTDQTTYYLLEITNSSTALTDFQISILTSSIGGVTTAEDSLEVDYLVLDRTWLKSNEIISDDGVYAYSLNDSGGNADSKNLKVTGFGNTLPYNARITGVKITVVAKASAGTSCYIKEVALIKNGTITSVKKTPAIDYLTTSDRTLEYGDDADMWSDTTPFLTPTMVNESDFGVAIKVNYDDAITAYIDNVRMTIYYVIQQDKSINATLVMKKNVSFVTDTELNTGTASGLTISNGLTF